MFMSILIEQTCLQIVFFYAENVHNKYNYLKAKQLNNTVIYIITIS